MDFPVIAFLLYIVWSIRLFFFVCQEKYGGRAGFQGMVPISVDLVLGDPFRTGILRTAVPDAGRMDAVAVIDRTEFKTPDVVTPVVTAVQTDMLVGFHFYHLKFILTQFVSKVNYIIFFGYT